MGLWGRRAGGGGGVGCKLVQFVVYCVLFVMMSTNIEKNSAVSEEGHVLTGYGFYLVVSLASIQVKSFWNPFSKINRPTDIPSAPQGNQCLILHFLAILSTGNKAIIFS